MTQDRWDKSQAGMTRPTEKRPTRTDTADRKRPGDDPGAFTKATKPNQRPEVAIDARGPTGPQAADHNLRRGGGDHPGGPDDAPPAPGPRRRRPSAAPGRSWRPNPMDRTPQNRHRPGASYGASEPPSTRPFWTAQNTSSCLFANPNFRWML